MIFFQSRVKSGQVYPILAKKLFVEKENRNFVSELVEPVFIPILLKDILSFNPCYSGLFPTLQ